MIKVEEDTHKSFKTKAANAGMSLIDYMAMVAKEKTVSPDYADVLKRVAAEAETEVLIKGLM